MDSRLQTLWDHHEIRETLATYCHGCDRGDEVMMAGVYARDAVARDDRAVFARTSDSDVPQRLADVEKFLGAGAIGVEFASLFAALGSEVILIELLPTLLPLEDPEIGQALERLFGISQDEFEVGYRAFVEQQIAQAGDAGTRMLAVPTDVGEPVSVERLVEQRGMSRDDAQARIDSQVGRDERRAMATHVIDNGGDLVELLRVSCNTAWRWLKVPRPLSCPLSRTLKPSSTRLPRASISPQPQSMAPSPSSISARCA